MAVDPACDVGAGEACSWSMMCVYRGDLCWDMYSLLAAANNNSNNNNNNNNNAHVASAVRRTERRLGRAEEPTVTPVRKSPCQPSAGSGARVLQVRRVLSS